MNLDPTSSRTSRSGLIPTAPAGLDGARLKLIEVKAESRAGSLDGEELSFHQLFRRQAERLSRALIEGNEYESFRLPC